MYTGFASTYLAVPTSSVVPGARHIYISKNIYCWVKNDDHSKFSGVSYNEALSVVEFWSVSDPKSSCPLIHLSEVHCVCEPRMYYTVLLRQAAANCSCMEIQIAHPLVQLPAG